MKKIIYLILMALAVSCSDGSSLVGPSGDDGEIIGDVPPQSFDFCILYPCSEEYSKTDTMHVEFETDVKGITQVRWDFPMYHEEDFSWLLMGFPDQTDSISKFYCKAIISNTDIPSWENRVDTLLIDYDRSVSTSSSPFKIHYNGEEMENLVKKESNDPWFYIYKNYDAVIRVEK